MREICARSGEFRLRGSFATGTGAVQRLSRLNVREKEKVK
jgi:hypothetical protein